MEFRNRQLGKEYEDAQVTIGLIAQEQVDDHGMLEMVTKRILVESKQRA